MSDTEYVLLLLGAVSKWGKGRIGRNAEKVLAQGCK